MVLLPQVHQFVDQHVVANFRRHLHEPEVQRDVPIARARSPSRALIPDRYVAHFQTVPCRQFLKPGNEFGARQLPEIGFNRRTQAFGMSEAQALRSVTHLAPRPARCHVDEYAVPAQQNPRTVVPFNGRMLRADAPPLALNPFLMFGNKGRGFPPRASTGDGDADSTVRTDAKDVPSSASHAHELDAIGRRLPVQKRVGEWKLELHERVQAF